MTRNVAKKDPAERSLDQQIAALSRWLQVPDRVAALAKAHEAAGTALTARLERQVDPDGTLDPVTRDRMVKTARKKHFAEMARKSHQARRARAQADQLEAEIRDALLPLVASPDAADAA